MWPFKKKAKAEESPPEDLFWRFYDTEPEFEDEPATELEPVEPVAAPTGQVYEGRLSQVGDHSHPLYGHLIADEGEWKGWPLAFAGNGEHRFIGLSELSHNQRFHQRYAVVDGTSENDPHHYEAHPNDAHYDETAPRKTTLKWDPDGVAATVTGHTEAYKNNV